MTGICTWNLRFLGVNSLKEKRKILRSFLDRIRCRYNVSIAEVGAQDTWQSAVIVAAHVSNDRRHIERTIQQLTSIIERECEIINLEIEYIS